MFHTDDDLPFMSDEELAAEEAARRQTCSIDPQFRVVWINGDDAQEMHCRICGGLSSAHGFRVDGWRSCPLYSVTAFRGDGYNAADMELVERGGAFVFASGYNLTEVVYFTNVAAAEAARGQATAPDDSSLVSIQHHDAGAHYINPARIHAVVEATAAQEELRELVSVFEAVANAIDAGPDDQDFAGNAF